MTPSMGDSPPPSSKDRAIRAGKALIAGLAIVLIAVLLWPALLLPAGPLAYGLLIAASYLWGTALLVPILAAALALGYLGLGLTGVWIAVAALALPVVAVRAGWRLRLRFWDLAGLGSLMLVLGLLGAYMLLVSRVGDPMELLSRFLMEAVGEDGGEYARYIADVLESLRMQLPGLTIQASLLGGASMAYLPAAVMRRRGVVLMKVPPPERWVIPPWARMSLFIIYGAAFLISLSTWESAEMLYYAATTLVELCFAAQGYSAGEAFLKRRGMRRGARTLLLLLAFCFLRWGLALLGIFDGWLLPRPRIPGPRPPQETKDPGDPGWDAEDTDE